MTARRFVIILATVASLALTGSAFADSSAMLSGYTSQSGKVQADVVSGQHATAPSSVAAAPAAAAQAPSTGSGLPFTGLDVGIVLAAGVALAALGLATRRLAGRSTT